MTPLGRAAAAAGIVLCLGCEGSRIEEPPPDIKGRWTTSDDPLYADRAFEIDDDFIYLLQGGDTFSVHKITSIRIEDGDLPLYVLEYVGDESDVYTFRFHLSREDGGTLFFPNQRSMKWHRDPARDVPWDIVR